MMNLRCFLFALVILAGSTCPADDRPNVLFISVDDLRPVLGCYGNTTVKTPHLDRLARRGVVFERAYCQVASCCPSRTAVLTGLRPASSGVFNNASPHFREELPDHLTLPGYFKKQGYFCKELGKVLHRRDPVSWSEDKWIPQPDFAYPIYGTPEAIQRQKQTKTTPKPDDWWGHSRWIKDISWEAPEVSDEELFDGRLATQAIAELRRSHDQPWFLAVGFFRPHLPFIAPKTYFDLYPEGSLKRPSDRQLPEAAPESSARDSSEPKSYRDIARSGAIPAEKQLELLRAYFASVSYVDAQIGRVFKELKQSGQDKNTLIVLWSDHGYHVGDHGLWGKATNFENAVRSTLIVSAPGISAGRSRGLVELLDLYPTLCELGGLRVPSGLAGESFASLLRSPDQPGKDAAYSQIAPRKAQGYSVRTDRHRFTLWQRDGKIVARELYDYRTDPEETQNIAGSADEKRLRELQSLLIRGHAQLQSKGQP